ncbi:MAG: hypothetical protein SAJ12_21425 [Jaaginema sp. PMC 1079.18]|nr:hypothetical protein [Jaaginema sp. PMC 1080.18]MEC4853549.1 hypothetical protein [Jaaginema sp. PMC 1079.18]MEC4865535.1 hypothetical protein [Jaaginema sp. PMC 1078.18]
MSPQLENIFTQIDSLNKEEQIEVFHYLEQRLHDDKEKDDRSFNESVAETERSAYDLLAEIGVIGVAKNLPSDLSSNKEYFKDFGH